MWKHMRQKVEEVRKDMEERVEAAMYDAIFDGIAVQLWYFPHDVHYEIRQVKTDKLIKRIS